MTFVVALLSWFLLSIPAALIIGRILAGTVTHHHAPIGIGPGRPTGQRFVRG